MQVNQDDAGGSDDLPEDTDDGADLQDKRRDRGKGQVKLMEGERVAFTEEGTPGQYLKLIASGEIDDTLLEALEDYVKRQRKRLAAASPTAENELGHPSGQLRTLAA